MRCALSPRVRRPGPLLPGVVLAAHLGIVAAPPVAAQEVPRHGFWLSIGMGVGRKLSDDAFVGGSWAGQMRAGGTVSPHVLIGGEALWVLGADAYGSDVPAGRGALFLTSLLYPWKTRGLFFKGGVGYTQMNEALALAANAGVGFDLRLSGNFYLTPDVDLLFVAGEGGSVSHFAFTIGVTWH